MTLQAFAVEISGNFTADQAERRGVATWSKSRTVLAENYAAAVERAQKLEPDATAVVVKGSRPPRWSELPLEASEIHQHSKRSAAASADGWKRRGRLARVFARSVRAGGATVPVFVVVVRSKS